MNQILDYNPNKKGNNSSGTDKIVRIFAIILIVFAICLVASGAYGVYKRSQEKKQTVGEVSKPKIEVAQEESDVIIKVTHNRAIEKIIYSWNDGRETNLKATGENSLEEKIPLPAGENTLHVKAIDIEGQEATYEGQFSSESGTDILSPVINISVDNVTKKIVIEATDETSLDFITYRWNSEEEEKIEATEDSPKEIRAEIEILKGSNDLTIVAVDSNNNTTTETKNFTGITKPEITVTVSEDKTSAEVQVLHENGLKEVKVNLNDIDHTVNIGTDNPKDVSFKIDFTEGNNKLVVTAISIDSTETVVTEEIGNNVLSTEDPEDGDSTEQTEPEISIQKDTAGENAKVNVNYENGIREIKLNVNDVDYDVNIGEDPSDLEFDIPLVEGNNKITLTVITVDGNEKQEIKEINR